MIGYHAMSEAAPPPPDDVPEGVTAVVVAYPKPGPQGRTHHTYRLWIVDAQQWTEPLVPEDAVNRLKIEGYKESRARGKLAQARAKARGQKGRTTKWSR